MQDSRLQGKWRSDARRTRQEIEAWKGISAQRAKKLKSLFGKLQLRFTRTHCHLKLDEHMEINRYKVVARDDKSVAILIEDPAEKKPRISHIHFEGTHFWINIGNGRLREFFRRVG